ncbi:hypothetical protein [Pengzhenrongella sicca]|uniref:Uncharacterized protein n=1 Tax=Pengzhenrongella sicca TaxID=2819238 RepID=A0A8A4ZH82_9MICO|nr:hypothetical protein [Pengzhenrongella sicca]QTE30751.1 hypothetical protein J4E96_07355 [Pengzhenrongella sicca]
MTSQRPPAFSLANLRQVGRLWSVVAFAGVALLLTMGTLLLTASGPFAPPRSPLDAPRVAAGEELEVGGTTEGYVLVGQPADGIDLAEVTCSWTGSTYADGTTAGGDLVVGPAARDSAMARLTDRLGGEDFRYLTTTADEWVARTATCSGGGIATLGIVADPGTAFQRKVGIAFIAFAPVLLGLAFLARRLTRPRA